MQSSAPVPVPAPPNKNAVLLKKIALAIPIIYAVMVLGQPAGFDLVNIINTIKADPSVILQQLINGLANGAIIAIIALGYTLVYGIIELVNFANGDVFMLGAMASLFAVSPFILVNPETNGQSAPIWAALLGFIPAMLLGAGINFATERVAYRRLRGSPKIVALISAIGMSFILQNVGLQLSSIGKLAQLDTPDNRNTVSILGYPVRLDWRVFDVFGNNNASPKSFPTIFNNDNLLDYIFPPPTAAPVDANAPANSAPTGNNGEPDIAATADAAIAATQSADATQLALATETPDVANAQPTFDPTQAAEETAIIATLNAEAATNGTPVAPEAAAVVAAAAAADTPDPSIPTLDPTQAAEETAIIGTLEAESAAANVAAGTAAPAEGTTPAEEPQMDLAATIAAEQAQANTQTTTNADGSTTTSEKPQSTNKIRVTLKDVLVFVIALILMVVLRWFVEKTRLGKAMRATAQNRAAAQIMGINIDTIISLTFIIGGALAGAAGMMSSIYNGTVVFTMGFTAGLRSFTAAVLGGIGNIAGAALGGILIGILAAFSDQFFSVRWTNAWVFLVLVLVLLFRPTGLLGSEGGEKA